MARKTRKASKPRRGKPAGDGLKRFSIHATEARGSRMLGRLASERPGFRSFAAAGGADLTRLDPETAASRQLEQALESEALPQFTRPKGKNSSSEFKSLGSETVPLTNTTTVKFRQTFDKIPVYGSLVTVELDDKNECLAINSSLGEPKSVDPIASIAPAEALAAAAKRAGYPRGKAPDRTPNLYYYYDRAKGRWALAFIIENMPVKSPGRKGQLRPVIKDYVIDAHSGTVLAELPRTPSASAVQDSALDGLAKSRTFVCERNGAKKSLVNRKLNVLTYDFAFKDPQERDDLLPGALVRNPPSPWAAAAVSAHANAESVALFLRNVVKRVNIDNKGGPMISSINCVVAEESEAPKQWLNAFWNGQQMVYGQRRRGGTLLSMAAMQDIVGHEMFHGVTDKSARIEYVEQSGALNESYSDIFGVIIANFAKADIDRWDWRIGVGFESNGGALRDMKDPTKYEQPRRMRDYVVTRPPYNDNNDWGAVHTNSGIHNYAAYRVMTSALGGKLVFTAREIAAMFYIALTQYLTRTSGFSDSRRAVVLAARTLFRDQPAGTQAKKIKAVEKGFSAAGITA